MQKSISHNFLSPPLLNQIFLGKMQLSFSHFWLPVTIQLAEVYSKYTVVWKVELNDSLCVHIINPWHETQLIIPKAARTVLPSPASVWYFSYYPSCCNGGYLLILPRHQGKHLLFFFDFQMPRDLLFAQPAHRCDMLFVLIWGTGHSVQLVSQATKQYTALRPVCWLCK